MIVEAYNDREQRDREYSLTSAYLTARWQRVKKMPTLKQVLEDSKPKKITVQTPEQMFDFVKSMQSKLAREEE